MSKLLIHKLALALAVKHKYVVEDETILPPFWRRTPSNLAYRLRAVTGWKIRGFRNKRTNKIQFERIPITQEPKKKIHSNV